MKKNIFKLKVTNIILTLPVLLFIGCSSDQDKKTDSVQNQKNATASGIEVVQNSNMNEIKVKERKKNNDKNSSYYFDYDIKSKYALNSKPANSDASVRERPRTALDANIHVRSPYEKVQISMLVKSLSKNFIVKCSACHNDYANGVIGPSLLSKSSDFIYEKIKKFKNDKNANVLMSDLVSNMDDKEIREIADEIFKFNTEINEMRKK